MPPSGAPRANADNAPPTSRTKLSENDRAELEILDAAVGRLQKVTRPDPYRISISQDEHLQYAHQYRAQQFQWLHNMPFSHKEEEGTQYQTFIYQEPGQNILSLHAQHYPEERPRTTDSTRNTTGSNTPAQGPKKRISLGAYKKKQAGETPTGEDVAASAKQPAVKGPAERVKALEAESADMLKAVEEDEKEDIGHSKGSMEALRKELTLSKQYELKRKRDDGGAGKDQTPKVNGHESPPPSKKAKTQLHTGSASKEANRHPLPQPTPAKRTCRNDGDLESQMPRKLSPLRDGPQSPNHFEMPPRLSPDLHDDFQMPPRLSSDLPPNIRKTLAAMDEARIVGRASKQTSNKKKEDSHSEDPSDPPASTRKSPDPDSRPQATSKRLRAIEQPEAKNSEVDTAQTSQVQLDKQTDDREGEGKKSLVAKIKFKKARKEDVQRILRLPARPDKLIVSPPATPEPALFEQKNQATSSSAEKATPKNVDRSESRRSGKGVAQKIGPVSKRTDETRPASAKRSRSELEEESFNAREKSGKRPKADDSTHGPPSRKRPAGDGAHETTKSIDSNARESKRPSSLTAQSETPTPSKQSSQKNQPTATIARKDSHAKREDNQQTDQASFGRPRSSTNDAQPNGTASKPSSKSAASTKVFTSKEWENEQRRLDKIGREIKHSATDLLSGKPNTAAREAAAIKCVESLMCYLLAFSCADRAAITAGKTPLMGLWRSLPPFYSFVERTTASIAPLSGLASALAVAFHAHIFELVAKTPAEAPSGQSFISLNSGVIKAAANTEEKMNVDTLMESFPKSWKGRTKASETTNDDDAVEPRRLLPGPYKLPMGLQTDPIQAARAGMAILKEWIAKEGLEYDFRIDA